MKKILLTLCVALASVAMYAAGLEGVRIYINPGHGSWSPNDRPMATIPYPNLPTTGMPDTCGFYESNTNLWKCLELEKKLTAAGAYVVMSRTANGPWPYEKVNGDYPDYSWDAYRALPDYEKYNRNITEIAEEVESGGYDYFISVHSNAAADGTTTNYPLLLYRGKDDTSIMSGDSKERATVVWPYLFEAMDAGIDPYTYYSITNSNVRGDIDFMGSSSTTSIGDTSYIGYYGELRHGVSGFLSEGYFHTYQPARHRALNPDYCRQEGIRYYRGIAAYYGLTGTAADSTGYILGAVKDAYNKMNNPLYTYVPGTHDQYVPCNGAVVTLYKAGVKVAEYNVDTCYNGLFYFPNLEPGADYTLDATCEGYKPLAEEYKAAITVEANATTYPIIYLEPTTYTVRVEADATMGSVTGAGEYENGFIVTLTATPNEGYKFIGWSDGNADNPRTIIVQSDTTFTALFENIPTVNVAYELNGGVTNDWGWTCPQDMYATLNADWNAFSGTSTVWTPLAELTDFTKGIPTQAGTMTLDFLESEGFKSHFQWLIEYMDTKATEQDKTLPSTNASYLRYNLAAFFKNTQRSSWPVSADYTSCGVSNYDAYKSHWKAAYANPTEPKEAFTLNAPYQEGKFFAGWYTTADFSGDKVTVIDSTFSGTLYAKWYDFPIVTIAEALALEDSTVCSVQGTVTFVAGNNLWMQDTQAAINVYQQNHGLQAGDKVIFKDAIKTVRYGIPQLSQADSIIIEGAGAIIPATVTIANLLADDTNAYLNHYVRLEGLRATWDGEDLYFRENDNKVLVYNSGITAADLPERQKLDAYVIVSAYNGVIQFRTALDLVTKTGLPAQDNYAYPARGENGEYTLKNDWIFSNTLDNFQSNRPNGQALYVRGMVAKDGIMYFADREFSRLVRVDGATGIMLEPIKLADNLWTKTLQAQDGSDSIVSAAVTMKNNDIKCDDAGNLLLGPCSTNSGDFQVWKVNPETGAGELVIHEKLWDDAAKDSIEWRIDAFDVYGDVNSSAIIMAANANAMNVFKWTIEEGKQVGVAEVIDLYVDPSENSYLLNDGAMITNPGTAPQIYIVDDNYFYIDGFSTLATLFNMDGTLADDFKNCAAGLKVGNAENDTTLVQTQQNGVVEFQVGNEHFLFITAAGTTAHIGSPNTFALYKYQNDNRFFADLEPLWFFPNDGMGTATNGSRMAPVSVEVDQKTGTAHLYVYACENGYGRYTLQVEGAAQPEPINPTYVDLGLPSGTLWATYNVGATSPEEYGDYFAWGETEPKNEYTWDTYKFGSSNTAFTKYNETDGLTTLEAVDDAATVNWGEDWRMPTSEEQIELRTACTWEWTDNYNETGVAGSIVTGKNGNSIFLPAAGYRWWTDFYNVGTNGSYYSSSLNKDDIGYADGLSFDSNNQYYGQSTRCNANTIRPVLNRQVDITLELHVKNLTMHPDEKYYLNTTVQPQDFDKSTLIWSSDNDEIASVENGLVTAHQTGTATITVTTPDSQLSSSCVVRIVNVGDDITYDVIINPSTESAEFSWPAIENASSYTFVIYADAEQTEKICTLTFDANGYLTRIDFMRTKSAATRDAHRGFQFVVTGLEPATTYGYALDSYTEQSTLIDRKIGEFTTTSSTTTALDNTAINESVTVQKVLENGTIYILKPNGEKYTVDGIRVE